MRQSAVPANKFLAEQYDARSKVRRQFANDAIELRHAHDLLLSSLSLCFDRFSNRPWLATVSEEDAEMLSQLGQQTALFLQGIDPCEVAIAEGMYVQASTLLKQRMEILAASNEIWRGTRQSSQAPSIKALPTGVQPLYEDITLLANAKFSDHLKSLIHVESGDLVGTALTPAYNKTLALLLFRIELLLLLNVAEHVNEFLKLGLGAGFDEQEMSLFRSAIETGNQAAADLYQ